MISGMFYRDSSTDTSIKNTFDTASYTQQAGNGNDDQQLAGKIWPKI
jgi:hypothetical protein